MDRSGYREDVTALFGSAPSRDQGSRSGRRLHYKAAAREAADDAVSAREVRSDGSDAQRKLGKEETLQCDSARELFVALGIYDIDPRSEHCDGRAGTRQAAAMGCRVDPRCEAAHDCEARVGKSAPERFGELTASGRT